MNQYSSFTKEDFAQHERFRKWIFNPDPDSDLYWKRVLENYPEKREDIQNARVLLLTIRQRYGDSLPDEIVELQVNKLRAAIQNAPPQSNWWQQNWWKVAAAVVLISGAAYLGSDIRFGVNSYLSTVFSETTWALSETNTTRQVITLVLPDSSVVNLEPGSTLSFPSRFTSKSREVALKGSAFFEVSHNPARPFFVHTNNTTTKVLGTSFRITTLAGNEVRVAVKTGKVMVYGAADVSATKASQQPDRKTPVSVTLLPEQEVVFAPDASIQKAPQIAKADSESPVELLRPKQASYEDAPLAAVLADIEKQFGVGLEYNTSDISNCVITATFEDESLIERINTICLAVGISYHPENGRIKVSGKGCTK